MNSKSLNIVLVSTPIGYIGSGKGGGVELTLISLIRGLISLGHKVTLVAPEKSYLPSDCLGVEIKYVIGRDQLSWQHQQKEGPIEIPLGGVLPKLWEKTFEIAHNSDAILNFGYDWLPLWITRFVDLKIFHLISMSNESDVMKNIIKDLSKTHLHRLAFHSSRQASDYELEDHPTIVGNGFDLARYKFQSKTEGPLGWIGRVAPEKGLEDAVRVAEALGEKLLVWGLMEDKNYADRVNSLFPKKIINYRGFLSTDSLQKEIGTCRALINTPKWKEAYGNVLIEAMACGVPVVSYDRGGPGELIDQGFNGFLVPPDDIDSMILSVSKVNSIDRRNCRLWVEKSASKEVFAKKIEKWILEGLSEDLNNYQST
ncbi:glycosyltransferase family 4 protein [Prochlorococcus sp. MIT 1223]|uniref:glycosyltransferase family 4 protein n=1 Tax=Prochlorococcus sp. MIT 1223 TaxID=3096217 RepID=UPI002A74C414|nr:glycosyltransferase family 4 protein [Prochlorococcus sp. MIT 1223]